MSAVDAPTTRCLACGCDWAQLRAHSVVRCDRCECVYRDTAINVATRLRAQRASLVGTDDAAVPVASDQHATARSSRFERRIEGRRAVRRRP